MKYKTQNIFFVLLLLAGLYSISCFADEDKYTTERKDMVEQQIKERGVTDQRVLTAMQKVPRHEFVPEYFRILAYTDRPLPIGMDQTISQPYIVALMTELLTLKETDKALEVGTGSGYQAAVLAEIVGKGEVYTIEIIPELADRAKETLSGLGYKNIFVKTGDGYYGWPAKKPFDAIIVTCGAPSIPDALVGQLKEGGRMVIPVGKGYQKLLLVTKGRGNKITTKFVTDVIFVPLLGGHE